MRAGKGRDSAQARSRAVRSAAMRGGIIRGLSASLPTALAAMAFTSSAGAATITPNVTADQFGSDAAHCALREAVQATNVDGPFGGCAAGTGDDVISLPRGTYRLTIPGDDISNAAGDLDLLDAGDSLTIANAGRGPAVIDANDIDRVLQLDDGVAATLAGVPLRNGTAPSGFNGGAIRNSGMLTLLNSTIAANSTDASGGGISNQSPGATLTMTNVTVFGNRADGDAGGVFLNNGTAALTNVTITENTGDADDTGDLGGGVSSNVSFQIRSSIVAGNTDAGGGAPDCAGTPSSLGGNLFGDGSGCSLVPGVDVIDPAPGLGALADNGGPTKTVALAAGSPALGLGTGCAASDQRGAPRSLGGKCDAGAYERITCRGVLVNR